MSKVITSPATNIPLHEKSHVRGWSLTWADRLNAEINERCTQDIMQYDKVYLDHGVNWSGALNLFAGADDSVFERFNRLLAVGAGKVTSLDWEMPDYGAFLAKRLNAASTSKQITAEWCEAVSNFCKEVEHIKFDSIGHTWLSWGDSHTPAYAPNGHKNAVLKKDGRTLFGALKERLLDDIEVKPGVEGVTICLGSIDVRHHLCRPESADLDKLLQEYRNQAVRFRDRIGVTVELCAPVPIEFESRKIPKTGYFKGTPFFGTREERLNKTVQIMSTIKSWDFPLVAPPSLRYTIDGEEYAKQYMELGGSVHTAPPFYRRNSEWAIL
jgi:hypothetical protein